MLEEMKEVASQRGGKCLATEYLTSRDKYLWEDSEGNQWYAEWSSIKRGRWSPFQSAIKRDKHKTKYTIEDLKVFAKSKGGKCLSDHYFKDKTKYLWEDANGNKFEKSWSSVLLGQWSPHEKKEVLSKNKRKYTDENLSLFAQENGYKYIGKSTRGNSRGRYVFVRSSDGFEVHATIYTLKQRGFPQKYSKQQREVFDFIKSLGLEAIENDRTIIKPQELDIVIPSLKIAIEFNGCLWHSEKSVGKRYHYEKTLSAKEAGYDLVQIFDVEWRDRKDQVMSYLTAKLGKNTTRLYARKCEVRTVDKQEAREFLNKYHILGACLFKEAFGLYHNNELVSLITIGSHHRNASELVLSRFVGKTGVSVVGGLSKLSKAAKDKYGEITTWVDRRISDGCNWIKAGWQQISEISPDYFYYNPESKEVVSKQSRRKTAVNTPKDMTERQHAENDGLIRIYDCGKVKFKF